MRNTLAYFLTFYCIILCTGMLCITFLEGFPFTYSLPSLILFAAMLVISFLYEIATKHKREAALKELCRYLVALHRQGKV